MSPRPCLAKATAVAVFFLTKIVSEWSYNGEKNTLCVCYLLSKHLNRLCGRHGVLIGSDIPCDGDADEQQRGAAFDLVAIPQF